MKKLVKLFALIALLLMSTVTANAVIISGSCGDGVTYTLNDDYSLVIEGNGNMTDYNYDSQPWSEYRDKIKNVEIKEGVNAIGNYSFGACKELLTVYLSNSITNIGDNAFSACSSLTSITIPNSVTSIGERAFSGCSSLTSINIPDGVTSIGNYAFCGCSSLTSINISNSVTSIGPSAFEDCTKLPVENNIRYADIYLVEVTDKSLSEYIIKDGTKFIGGSAFRGCNNLTGITIPNSVTSIGHYAFRYCSSLTSVIIPNNVTSIARYAFGDCSSLTSITIPNSVMSIETGMFSRCSNLTSITIPNSVTSIGSSAFYGCSSLTSITIPNSVASIGSSAFKGCEELTSVTNLSEIPQAIVPETFSTYGTLHVLPGCKIIYAIIYPWNKFTIVEDAETTGIEVVLDSKDDALVDGDYLYTLDGRKVMYSSNLPTGIYVRNGKKMIVK